MTIRIPQEIAPLLMAVEYVSNQLWRLDVTRSYLLTQQLTEDIEAALNVLDTQIQDRQKALAHAKHNFTEGMKNVTKVTAEVLVTLTFHPNIHIRDRATEEWARRERKEK